MLENRRQTAQHITRRVHHHLPWENMDAEYLVRTLRAYDSSVDAATVRTALSDPQSAEFLHWAALHLTPDTLLSVDELNQ